MRYVTQMTDAQTDVTWFMMRVGSFTSSTTVEGINATIQTFLKSETPEVVVSAQAIAAYFDIDTEQKEEKEKAVNVDLSDEAIKKMAGKELKDEIKRRNQERGLTSRKGLALTGKVAELRQRLLDDSKKEHVAPTDPKKAIVQILLKKMFIKKLDEKKHPGLALGRDNEQNVLNQLTNFVYKNSNHLIMDTKTIGLVERKDKRALTTAIDALVIDMDCSSIDDDDLDYEFETIGVEIKTATIAETIAKATHIRNNVGLFSEHHSDAYGTPTQKSVYMTFFIRV